MEEVKGKRIEDWKLIKELGEDKFAKFFFTHIRNLWRVDGLYFLGIEKRFGTLAATEIDAECWKTMGIIEAKELKKLIDPSEGLPALKKALLLTSWSLDHIEKEVEIKEDCLIYSVYNCRTQLTRLKKGLEVFPCKKVREGFMKSFVETFNPEFELKEGIAPPERKEEDGWWCRWIIKKKEK